MTLSHPDIDAYVAGQPEPARAVVNEVREILHAAAPGAEEAMRYQMPTLLLDGASLVHFAAWKRHLGLYPLPDPAVAMPSDRDSRRSSLRRTQARAPRSSATTGRCRTR